MILRQISRMPQVATFLLLAASPLQAYVVPLQQFGSVVHERNSHVVWQQTSTELNSLDLQVGLTFNEAGLDIDHLPPVVPWRGFTGLAYAASSSERVDRLSQAIFDYDFELLYPTDYSIRFTKHGDAVTTLTISNVTDTLVSFSENQEQIAEGRLEPGEYRFSINASAFASYNTTGTFDVVGAQLDFWLFLYQVPEPGTLSIATGLTFVLLGKRRRSK